MTLDQRLRAARDDYRALTPPGLDGLDGVGGGEVGGGVDPTSRTARSRRRRWLAVAALLVVVGGAVSWAVARQDEPDRIDTAGSPTTSPADSSTSVAEPGSDAVALEPAGPYRSGQEIDVRVRADLAEGADLLNEGVSLCVTVAVDDGPSETCPPVDDLVIDLGASSATVRLSRAVFTDTGTRDCNDDGVDCRIVVLAGDGSRHRSERLTFVDQELPPPEVTLRVDPTGAPGEFTVTPDGLRADESWLDLRADEPERAAGLSALPVRHCAFGASLGPTPGPFGDDLWGVDPEPSRTDQVVCSSWGPRLTIDPDDPDATLTIVLPTAIYGYAGWADCRVDQCFLEVRRTLIHGYGAETGTMGSDVSVASALLPRDAAWGDPARPALTVETPGPHRAGQVVTVTIAGLPDGRTTHIAQCTVDAPWGCGYDLTERGNGTHQVTLHDRLEGCDPQTCYLELDSQGEGLPPLATAPLDTPG